MEGNLIEFSLTSFREKKRQARLFKILHTEQKRNTW